ncbi:hypothetical protein FRC03_007572 [Tulasnella sp. 419]|nr:hypothetical protein FRC03_007572 [Tulasnella sp. 419]
MDFYLTLMKIVERHHPESMSVTRKDNQAWRKWWGTMVQIFPGLLRVFLKVDEPNRLETAEMVLRIIAQVIPDDWMEGTALQQRGVISQLRHISPHDSESRVGITSLIGTFLDAPDPYGCKTTREAAAEVLGWIMTMEEHLPNAGLPKSIADPTGIYQRSTSIPSFLSVVVTDTSVDEILRLFLQRRFDFLLNLPHPQDGSISATQLEAFIISLTHLHEFPHFRNPCDILEEPPQTVKCIRGFMDRITNGSSESLWPHSFIAAGIIESRPYGTRPYQTVQTLIADDDMLLEDDDRRFLWMGSAITIAWKRFVKTTNVSTNHLSAIFSNDAISMVLLSYDTALKTNISVDFRLLDDYLDAAQRAQKVGKQLQQRVEDARVSLTLVLLGSR